MSDRRERDLRARGGLDVDAAERGGVVLELLRHLHHHVVLVELLVGGGDLALAEGIRERGVNGERADAEARCGVAVDDQLGLQALALLVGCNVLELG